MFKSGDIIKLAVIIGLVIVAITMMAFGYLMGEETFMTVSIIIGIGAVIGYCYFRYSEW